eukprot:TRINITY_DN38_c1_g1_i1.p1 TRINITY_DN38_c1_g1~~TRINITY_DN38_c1_g1_i1.p1  ORF type:complete len:463 (-),score=66.69 TRINITY_DN38_c1_g1_i1:688-2076(-)
MRRLVMDVFERTSLPACLLDRQQNSSQSHHVPTCSVIRSIHSRLASAKRCSISTVARYNAVVALSTIVACSRTCRHSITWPVTFPLLQPSSTLPQPYLSRSQPRVKLLALLDGHPHANVKSSLLDRTLYCIVAMASDDAAASVAQQLQRNAREVVKLQLPPLLGRGDGSELAVPFVRAMASLTYPELLPEAKPYLLSNDEVSVEQGSTGDTGWLAFRPTQRPPVASVLLLQGKAVPAEGYAGLLQRLARLGYVCIVVAAPGRDADYVPQDTIIQIMHAHAEQSTGEWFIAAHSGGGLAATRWARSHLDLVPHKAHSSKDEVPEVQQCSEAAQKTPPSTPPGIRLRGVLLLAATAGGFVKDDERGKHLPFLQLVGTCDGGYHRVPNSAEYYLNKHLAPYVPQSSITVVPIEGGTHGGWAWFGYKDPYLLGWISLEDQQQQGAEAADKWMQQVLGSGDQCASTA